MNNLPKAMPLSDRVKAIILGSLLGDGSLKINQGYANARFSFRHFISQKEYFQWKARELAEISSEESVFLQKADGFSKNEKLRFQSRALPALTSLHTLTNKHNRLLIQRKWLNQLTPLSLAVWWCDDGSVIGKGRKGVICTDGFDEKSVQLIARWLEIVWKVRSTVGPISRVRDNRRVQYWRLWLATEELKKFLRVILPYVPVPSMLYKFILLYNDPQLQQRWISEVITLSSFSSETVQRALEEKIKKHKIFQKMI